jgi:uncharacterized protein
MPTIVHFEIPTDNVEKSRKFYSELFDWNVEKWTGTESMPEEMEYWTVITTYGKRHKAIGGGLMKRQNPQQQGIMNYIDVRSVDEYSSKVGRLGGKIVVPKMPVKGMGYFAVCLDTENNTFGIWETNSEAVNS